MFFADDDLDLGAFHFYYFIRIISMSNKYFGEYVLRSDTNDIFFCFCIEGAQPCRV